LSAASFFGPAGALSHAALTVFIISAPLVAAGAGFCDVAIDLSFPSIDRPRVRPAPTSHVVRDRSGRFQS
jgi:hypothetical protein